MSTLPEISIGLPVYNGLPYVKQLIEGMLAQSFGNLELVISDNASTDGTDELCRSYARADSRVKYFRNASNIGLIPNFNRVFEYASAPYYKWAASDDIYEPTYLEACYPAIRDNEDVSVSHTETILVNEDGQELPYDPELHACRDKENNRVWLLDRDGCATQGSRSRRFGDVLGQQIMCSPVYGLMRRDQILQTGLHRSFFGSDKPLLAEMALFGRFYIAPGRLFKKRMHTGMTSVMSGGKLQNKIDPSVKLNSLQVVKLKAYLGILAQAQLTPLERAACYAYLGLYSASAAVPEMLRYRPELVSRGLGLKRPAHV
jgi:glycosyltransferase involved in cell wall biosynthesis